LALLLVPPYTDATDAYRALTKAVTVGDVSTPEQLLGISEHSPKDRRQAHVALGRRERGGLRWSCRGPRL
jgi:hypothetical protein